MAANAELNLVIGVVDKASGPLAKLTGGLGTLAKIGGAAFLGGAIAGVGALGAALVTGIGDARDAALVFAQTEAVIKSTGGAAGFTAEQIADMAGSLSAASGKSLFGDDDIQRGQNMLLTFTNIKETLPDATQTMLDMAQALGTDAGGAAVQLGKALNDPINGVSALTRVGVTFTDQQKEQIKTLQESGDMAGAQAVILAELNKEFGGSAAAAAAADGGFAQFKDRMGELAESIGARVLPVLNDLMGWLNSPAVQAGIDGLVNGFIALVPVLGAVTGPIADVLDSIIRLFNPQYDAGAFANSWSAAFNEILLPAFNAIVSFINDNLTAVLSGLAAMLVFVVVPAFVGWATAAGAAALATIVALAPVIAPIAAIGLAVGLLVAAWENDWGGMRTTLTAWWDTTVRPILVVVQDWLEVKLTAAMASLQRAWEVAWPIIQAAVQAVYSFLSGTVWPWLQNTAFPWLADVALPALKVAFELAWSAISTAVSVVYAFLKDTVWPWISEAFRVTTEEEIPAIRRAFETAWPIIQSAVSTVYTFLKDVVWPWLQTAMTNIGTWITTAKDTWSTAWGAISGAVTLAKDTISGVIQTIKDLVQGAIDKVNALIDLINKIPGVPDIPGIPGFASGVQNFSGGLAVVGERGPELLHLPRGSNVYTAQQTRAMVTAGPTNHNTFNFVINTSNRREAELGVRDALVAGGLL